MNGAAQSSSGYGSRVSVSLPRYRYGEPMWRAGDSLEITVSVRPGTMVVGPTGYTEHPANAFSRILREVESDPEFVFPQAASFDLKWEFDREAYERETAAGETP